MKFPRTWNAEAKASKIEPIAQVARTLEAREGLLLNWFKAGKRFDGGIVEGFNLKVGGVFRRAFGYKAPQAVRIALLHALGNLPEERFAHPLWCNAML